MLGWGPATLMGELEYDFLAPGAALVVADLKGVDQRTEDLSFPLSSFLSLYLLDK